MKAQLTVNGITVELSHSELNEIAFTLDSCDRYKDLFHELASSPCTETYSGPHISDNSLSCAQP